MGRYTPDSTVPHKPNLAMRQQNNEYWLCQTPVWEFREPGERSVLDIADPCSMLCCNHMRCISWVILWPRKWMQQTRVILSLHTHPVVQDMSLYWLWNAINTDMMHYSLDTQFTLQMFWIVLLSVHLISLTRLVHGGRNEVDPRFMSLFSVFNVTFPSMDSLFHIYSSILTGHLQPFKSGEWVHEADHVTLVNTRI